MRFAHFSALSLAVLLGGCLHGHPWPRTPMAMMQVSAGGTVDTLVVLLPGLKDRARVFQDEGFLEIFRRRHIAADLWAVDAHSGYYAQGTLLRRLQHDVIAPARRRYRHIILVGVSMGGYGAIRYALTYPHEISQLVLLSPFLGAGPFMRGLADAGDEDYRQTWDWLKSDKHPPIVLGYGQEDAFLKTDSDLRSLLPPGDVVTTTGVHVWGTWRAVLEEMLEKGLIK